LTEIIYKDLSYDIVGAAQEVHRVLGSGYLETVYQAALAQELTLRHIKHEQQKRLTVEYKGVVVGEYQADFLVEDCIILELKAVSALNGTHEAQALNYLAGTGLRLAILLNFGAESLEQTRVINRNRRGLPYSVRA
jgi:GxxExxY protein